MKLSPHTDLTSNTRRWLRVGEWLILAVLLAHFCVRTVPTAWRAVLTDFPDYYFPAALAHQHCDTSRVYEWIWSQRQGDHSGIDVPMISLVPSTTFSSLVVYPLAGMSMAAAKHCWFFFNFGLLAATLYLLRRMTELRWRTIALVAALSFPLRGNFIGGQYYLLLLFLLTLACYLYLRQQRFAAGLVVGLAAGLKIFPVIYLLYFLRKRDLKALAGGVIGGLSAAAASLLAFGWEANRTYLLEVLPWTLRGEALATYTLKNPSLSSLLHRLFIYEPQLNPHPAINAPWLFAVLHPLLQMAIMAPALLLAAPGEGSFQPDYLRRVRLEWAAILVASLAISTSPQSYQFTLLILPVCIVLEALRREKALVSVAVLVLYTAAGYLTGTDHTRQGWGALLGVSRLYLLVLSSATMYMLLYWLDRRGEEIVKRQPATGWRRDRFLWAVALCVLLALGIWGNLRHQRGLYDDYRYRIPISQEAYMAIHPAVQGDSVLFIAMLGDGYHSAVVENGMLGDGATQFSRASSGLLSVTSTNEEIWVEQTGHESTIVSTLPGRSEIAQAESPVASFDGRWLAFLREDKGRGRIWLHALGGVANGSSTGIADRPVTPPELNVLEMSFVPDGDLVFAASSGVRPGLFRASGIQKQNQTVGIRSIDAKEARYPAVSPDGHWLAYSRLQAGNWNLWLRDLTSGQTQRLTHAECNATEPAWDTDSKTLVYASDCGRALWYSALCRRRILP